MASLKHTCRRSVMGLGLLTLVATAQAIPLTLDTTYLDAKSVYTFNSDTASLMEAVGLSASALGNTKAVAGSNWQFMMPVTQVTVNTGLFPLGLTPVSGQASGSGLMIKSETGALTLANFALDFKRNVLMADLGTGSGITKSFDVYSFTVDQGLHLSTANSLSFAMNLTHMTLTSGAQVQFVSALQLDDIAASALPILDFGTLAVSISPALRFGLSNQALVASIPEPPSYMTLALGMVGLAWVTRRSIG